MLILGLLGMYFDAAVVFVTKSSLLFRLAVAILCLFKFNVCKVDFYPYCRTLVCTGTYSAVVGGAPNSGAAATV